MVGSDPVWPVEHLDSWDEPDSGWEHYRRFVRFHRQWLGQLEPAVAEKLRIGNARALFRKPRPGREAEGPPGRGSEKRTEAGGLVR